MRGFYSAVAAFLTFCGLFFAKAIFANHTVTVTTTNVLCNGQCNGTAKLTVSNGSGDYTYQWFEPDGSLISSATTDSLSGMCVGTYTSLVTDNQEPLDPGINPFELNVIINEPGSLVQTSQTITNTNCSDSCDGKVKVSITGGTPPRTFSWSNGQTALNLTEIDSLCAGTYTLTVTDANSCTKTFGPFTVTEPNPIVSTFVTTNPPCNGTCTGTITTTTTGGTSGYTYLWSNGSASQNLSNLCASTYTVTATDTKGCTGANSATITQPPALTFTQTSADVTCNGACDGTMSITASGGTTGYTYTWSDIGLGSSSRTSVCANSYSVTITDAGSCTTVANFTISEPTALSVSTSVTDLTCNASCDGKAMATASGGTSPYAYLWNTTATADSIFNQCAATYTVTVTDANGCTATASVTISEPALLTVSISSIPISCNGVNDGSLTANPSGGTTNYSYLWSSGQTTQTINSLSAGAYCVTVTDANGCDTSACFTLTAPSAINANLTFTDVTCNGACNGTASVLPTGGTSPYTISWSGGLGSGTSVSGICPNSYTVTILDAAGCSKVTPFTIIEPSAIVPSASATDVSCSGVCDGTTTCTPSGGTTPYTFNWDIPSALQTNTGLCANTYNLTVTDANGCTKTSSATVDSPTPIAINLSSTDATCPDFCNGTATVVPSGGVPGYTILWSNDSTSSSISLLCAGNYGVTITDVTACTASQGLTILGPADITINLTSTDPTCNGGNNGFACVSPTGGTSPFTYLWSSGSTDTCTAGLAAGNHSVNITDFNGCVKSQSFSLSEPTAISTTISQLNQTCSGFCDGIGNVSVSGGISPYTYLWSPSPQTDSTATGLCGGNNIVTVTDSNSCTAIDTVFISSSVVITITSTIVNEDCNAIGCDGSATASANGGASPYDFVWSNNDFANGATSSLADSLCQGTYYVSATDALGCLSVDSIEMTVADSVLQVTDNTTHVSCNGNCDAIIEAVVTGGTGPGTYTYSWTGFSDTDSIIDNLCPGTYSVLVIDGNQCRDSLDIDVTEPNVLDAFATGTDITCNGICNGTATASQTGGTPPYAYLWSDGQSTQTATGLCVDTFTVTITDANGCTGSASVSVAQPPALSATATNTPVSCNGGADGTATVSVSGGTTAYSFVWSNAKITQTITSLTAGVYIVTVTDAAGCTTTASTTVSQPSALSVSISKTDVLCNGNCNGTATANPSGGTAGYTYLWSNSQTTQTATGFCAGTFSVTVTDSKGCTKTASVTISEPSALSISTSQTNVTCNGTCDGTATATASAGISPHSYLWSDGQTTQTATGLCNGIFTVTATDANSCTITGSATITQPSAITATPNPISANCGVCDGTAKFTIAGGTIPYTHSWNTGSTSYPLTNLCAAVYTDTISDANGCQLIASCPVSNISGPDGATIISNNVTCYASCDGSAAIVAVSGGTSPYTYLWPDVETDTVMTGICASTNILQITDALTCIHFETFVIDEPDSLEAGIIITDATCAGLSNGTATANAFGGTGTLTYNWSTGATTSSITNLSAGNYPITVTDGNGCTVLDTAAVSESTALSLMLSVTNVLCNGNSTGVIAATPSGGTSPFSFVWSDGQISSSATGLVAGNYSVTVNDVNGCSVSGIDTVNESSAISISSSVTDATCGLSDGEITVSASGGNSPYTFVWLNGQNGATATGLAAGTESVEVTDANSCVDTFDIGISNVNGPGTSTSVTNASCSGTCDGTGSVTITSGVSPFTYLWIPGGQTTSSVIGLCTGNYNIEVADGNNCTTVQTVTVSEPTAISASFTKTNASCNGTCDGTATVTASGGVIPYSYLWSNAATTQFVSALCAGTFTVTITDANGCTGIDSVTITEPSVLSASATGSAVACNGDCNGTATVTASSGTAGYSYNWSSGASASVAASLCAGSYTVTITDANGCTTTATASVSEPSVISITAIPNQTTCGNCDGSISIALSGGTSPYTRLWSTGSTSAFISNLCTNIYDLTVTDANGCSADSSFIINSSDGPIPVLTGDTTSCFNFCDATATSSTSGGMSPYTFLWDDSNAQITSSATGLCDGIYALYVTDDIGCIGIGITTIAEPTQLANTISTSDADCNTSCDVTATANVSGGTSAYLFLWSDGQTNSSATGLCSGTFFVTVSDANGCSRIDSVVVNETSTLSLTISGTNSNCFNSCDGLATANVSSGSSPYSYLWSNSATTLVITNLCIGTYILTLTDNNGCEKIDSVTITEPTALSSSITGTDINCNNGNDGLANVSVSGGTTPYSYNWSPSGQTDSTATGLSSGTHNITVTDVNGCTIDTSVAINQPTVLTLDSIVTTNTACGDTNGTAAIYVSGGATPYSYLWSDGQTTQTATGLLQGSYDVTVTYNGTCDTSFSGIVIANTNGATVTMDSTDANCNGNCDGTATAIVSGGTTPYSYFWSDGQTDSTATGLCAATYDVTVTDGNGCITLASVSVNEPTLLTATISGTDITCNGANDGTASVSENGGTSPYTYQWNNAQITSSIINLSSGNYCVTVTDANGCDTTVCVTINEPSALSLTTSFTNTTCNGTCNGDATVNVSGGISLYTFLWSDGQTNSTATGLCDGNYTVTITDANGCTNDTLFTITEPNAISATFTQNQPACGSSDGSVSVNATGGTSFTIGAPYTYLWDAGGQTDSTATGLAAGSYSVTVTDSLNCTSTFTTNISNLNGPTVVIDSVDSVICFGNSDGAIYVTSSGINVPFTFLWSSGQTTEDAINLSAGNDTLTVTDTAGCVTIIDTIVSEPILLTASISATDATCSVCNGTATATVSGGTGAYTFDWVNPQTTSAVTGLCAGADSVIVTDENGCTATASTTIIDLAGPTAISFTSNDATCFGICDGSANVSVVGGTLPFTYLWNDGQTDSTATALCAGTYTISVDDANGCTIDSSITINETSDIVADSIVIVDATCGVPNGSITIYISGGTSPYNYLWNDGQTDSSATGLAAGIYGVTVIDANGCTKIFSGITVNNANGPTVSLSVSDVTCNGFCNGSITAIIVSGTSPFTYLWSNADTTSVPDTLCAGNYFLTVTDSLGCSTIVADSVAEPALLIISATSTEISCNSANDGSATVAVAGGTLPYTFLWSDGSTNDIISNLPAGNYCVTVTDAKGCSEDTCITITEPSALSLLISSTNNACFGDCSGIANASVSGGISPYSYSWSNSQTDSTAMGLCAGTYSVTITDASVCSVDSFVVITEPNALVADSILTTDATCLDSNGTATIFVSGGTSPYTYLWNDAFLQTTSSADSLFIGSYSVVVTDDSLCTKTFSSIIINNVNAPNATATVTDVKCNGDSNGIITVSASGGTPPYGFQWSTAQLDIFAFSSTADSLSAGEYIVTVSDANGCMTVVVDTVNEPQILIASATSTNISCNGANDGTACASASGGVSPYSFQWSQGSITQCISLLFPGIYCVTITDANNCTDSVCITISEPSALSVDSIVSVNVLCNGDSSGSAEVFVSGGTSPYSYSWSNAAITSSILGLPPSAYFVTITDSAGCTITNSVVITEPSAMVLDSSNIVSPPCGDSTGTTTIFVSGGTSPYTYQWQNGDTISAADSLKAGTYSVTVTDSALCTKTFSVNVSNLGAQAVTISIADVSCGGTCDGMAVANVSGGTSPYTFLWSSSEITDTIKNLCPNIYSVTVTDAASCIVFASDTVNAGNVLASTMSVTNILCNGDSTGSISVNVTGGATPYTYLWNNGQSDSTATGLIAGTYCVTVNDAGGCLFAGCDSVSQPDSALIITVSSTNTTCNGVCDGTATANVLGGTSPYNYQWCDGSTSPTITDMCAMTCGVAITDANGCVSSTFVVIPEPSAITLVDTLIPPTCGSNNGSISITASGGTPFSTGYTYVWNNAETTFTINSLTSGTYCVTVTDSLGCTFDTCYTLIPPPSAIITVDSIVNVHCNGKCDGEIYISVAGDSPFTYLWSNADTNEDIVSLCQGNYFLTVTDTFGCSTTFDTLVSEPPALTVSTNVNPAACGACNGDAVAIASGGISPYSYEWSNNDSGDTADSLCAGGYDVTVTDANGCTATVSIAVSNLGGPDSVTFAITNASCFNNCDGAASSTVFGGTSPFIYEWSSGENTPGIFNVCSGNYTLSVTDSSGCLAVVNAFIDQPNSIDVSFLSTPPTCGANDGQINAVTSGGTPFASGYTYEWSANAGGQTTAIITGLAVGTYFVTVTDSIGCTQTFSTTLSNSDAIVFATVANVTCFEKCDGSIVTDSSFATNLPLTYLWIPGGQTDSSIFNLCAGNYTLEITDAFGCKTFQDYTISEPEELSANFSLTDATCGQCNGEAVITVFGGNSPYDYLWTNNSTTPTPSALCAGVYSAEITDDNGCKATFNTGINNTDAPVGILTPFGTADVSCFGLCDGSATVDASGGVSPYTFFWVGLSPANNTNFANNLCAGTYFVEITGENECISTFEVIINQPAGLNDSANVSMPTCNGSNGSVEVFISGGITPYDYLWSTGNTTNSISGIVADIYKLTVTDNGGSGCSQAFTYILNSENAPSLEITGTDVTCNSVCDGSAIVTATGGVTAYAYQWLNSSLVPIGQTDSTATALCAGTYFAQVTDATLCLSSIEVDISEPPALDTSLIFSTNNLCFGDCNGTANAVINGGTQPYNYLWNDGNNQIANPATGLCAGTYSVIITDANNCNVSQSASVSQPNLLTADTNLVTDALCFDSNNGAIDINVSGGTTPYSYLWSTSETSEDISNLLPGLYSVTVTDTNFCDTALTIIVDTIIALTIEPLLDTQMCQGESVMLIANANGNSTIDYLWSPDVSLNSANIATPITTTGTTQTYTLTVSISGQCAVSDSLAVTVNPNPIVDAGDGVTVVKGVTAAVGGNPTAVGGAAPYTYLWSPEDGLDDPSGENPKALPAQTTWYSVTVTDAKGCTGSDSAEVTVVPLIQYISGFSPNGDGINDKWQIEFVEQFPDIDVEIYNRWGQLLFKSKGYKDPWDGTYNGKPLPIGTYYYVIVLNHPKFPDPITGPVTILK